MGVDLMKEAKTLMNDQYDRAAKYVVNYGKQYLEIEDTKKSILSFLSDMQKEFAPKQLISFSGKELLSKLFFTGSANKDNLCYKMEFDKKCRLIFGTIANGSLYKYKLFCNESGQWLTGSQQNPRLLTNEKALDLGKKIRDILVRSCQIVESSQFDSLDDYEIFGKKLNKQIKRYSQYGWLKKYLYIMYPQIFVGWYAGSMLKHMLLALRIMPELDEYRMIGQLSKVKSLCNDMSPLFEKICFDMFGMMRHFYAIQTYYGGEHYASQWKDQSIIGLVTEHIGDLNESTNDGKANDLKQENKSLQLFCKVTNTAVFVALDGLRPLAFVDHVGNCEHRSAQVNLYFRRGTWHDLFLEDDQWNIQTSDIAEIEDNQILLLLYQQYYHFDEISNNDLIAYHTGYKSSYYRNRIIYGAPGTGKSFRLEKEVRQLVGEDVKEYSKTIEFYPDYSYAQFVGTYEPVPYYNGNDYFITYKFVPGPFIELYVKAIQSARSGHAKPYVLVIDEMNRADAASVFGNLMRLLDRDRNGTGKYDVDISVELRQYLMEELGGDLHDYETIRLPDNMFIWATVNLSDQGAQVMDAAFKRRWHFEHIGIDDNDDLLDGKFVVLGEASAWKVEWNKLRKAINSFLLNQNVNEDKLLGPYFLSEDIVVPKSSNEIDRNSFINEFSDKVIMYLFEDAARLKRSSLFDCKNVNSLSSICEKFKQRGIEIFNHEIQKNSEAELISYSFDQRSGKS